MNEELKEWLGLTKADVLVYSAFALLIAGFFIVSLVVVSLLYGFVIVLSIFSIRLGSAPKEEVSKVSNSIKAYAYHVCFGIAVIIIIFRLVYF